MSNDSTRPRTDGATMVYRRPLTDAAAQRACGCDVCKRALAATRTVTLPGYVERIEGTVGFVADPGAERERRRREIDAVLREDARRWPAFATARRAAVMAWSEKAPRDGYADADDARSIVSKCHAYEEMRGAMTVPSQAAQKYAAGRMTDETVAAYERARGL